MVGCTILLILAGCAVAPVAKNAPASLDGMWRGQAGDAPLYLFFLAGGEFRAAADPALLYDAPIWAGRFTYDSGRLSIITGGAEEAPCRAAGRYIITTYEDTPAAGGPVPRLTLTVEDDACASRREMLDASTWVLPPAEG